MDELLYNSIRDELTKLLNREPTEQEIYNGQTDIHIKQKIQDKKIEEQDILLNEQQTKLTEQAVEISKFNK